MSTATPINPISRDTGPIGAGVPSPAAPAGPGIVANPLHAARTVWGFTPSQIHDRFWAARGVQVVRQGEPSEIVADAELFLLTVSRLMVIFELRGLLERLSWLAPDALLIRLEDKTERGYREQVVADDAGRFVRFQRIYGGGDAQRLHLVITPDRHIARAWQSAADPRAGWRTLRAQLRREDRAAVSVAGSAFDAGDPEEASLFMRRVVEEWKRPDLTIHRARKHGGGVWIDPKADAQAVFVGPCWVGTGRDVPKGATVVGPTVLWDDPAARPPVEDLQWQEIEPADVNGRRFEVRQLNSIHRLTKRLFDIAAAMLALAMTLPLYPLIMLAIWLEDGRPFFFAHTRESMGGREFGCIKFRSMRKDAEAIKARLMTENKADGPQFFMKNDPRLTRVGKVLRDLNIDELPQFINVLMGHMSLVGPRPSPFKENQYCPPWREARLSVRPGITGLWQVMRSRRQGLDFQEWIRYDIQYVENISWGLDLWIIWKTIVLLAFKPESK